MLVHAHAAGHAIHDNAKPLLRHANRLMPCCSAKLTMSDARRSSALFAIRHSEPGMMHA
jgi:hypothetical protein